MCERTAIYVLSEESTWELEMRVNQWDKQIGGFFDTYTQNYEFEP